MSGEANLPSNLAENNIEKFRLQHGDNTSLQVWRWSPYRKCHVWQTFLQVENVHRAVLKLITLELEGKIVLGLNKTIVEEAHRYFEFERKKNQRHGSILATYLDSAE
jgi:hypothetical protein